MRAIVIAHRGASGYRPEHTLASYQLAIEQGADFIEPDLVMTRDGVLVARHENEISGTTDVSQRDAFATRRTRKRIDGVEIDGWFTEDFTLAELKTLRAKERIPALRPDNRRYDGAFEVPTFEEILSLLHAVNVQRAALALRHGTSAPPPIGVYPETKHPSYFAACGLPMERALVDALQRRGYAGRGAPVFIQSFETANLRELRAMTDLPLIQLLAESGQPYDLLVRGEARRYADLCTPAGLDAIAAYADGIGPHKDLVVPRSPDGALAAPTALVANAHARGLKVHPWTFRAENHFLPARYRSSGTPYESGDLESEIAAFIAAGVDGFFTDQPDRGKRVTTPAASPPSLLD